MLNVITPDMIVKAAGLIKQGKVYALGEEVHSDVPRVITPARVGVQIIQERDGYDRAAKRRRISIQGGPGRCQLYFHA